MFLLWCLVVQGVLILGGAGFARRTFTDLFLVSGVSALEPSFSGVLIPGGAGFARRTFTHLFLCSVVSAVVPKSRLGVFESFIFVLLGTFLFFCSKHLLGLAVFFMFLFFLKRG